MKDMIMVVQQGLNFFLKAVSEIQSSFGANRLN